MFGEDLVLKCCNYIQSRQNAVVGEYNQLHKQIKDAWGPDISGEQFANNVKMRFLSNYAALENFYGGRSPSFKKLLTNRLFYNPQDFIVASGFDQLNIHEDESVVCNIAQNKSRPHGFEDDKIPELGQGEFWGSSEPSIYGNILYLMSRNPNSAVSLNKNSSFLHVTPLTISQAQPLIGSEYLYQNGNQYGLAFAHTGYVYNGNRIDDKLYDTQKTFAPKDCSQFVQEMLGHEHKFITEDMLYMRRYKQQSGYIRKDWLDTPVAAELNSKLKSVPIEDVQPGDIHVKWDFLRNTKPTSAKIHYHGHTTIVFSKLGSEVLTLGDGQSFPDRDGFGLETYSAHPCIQNEESISETRFYRAIT